MSAVPPVPLEWGVRHLKPIIGLPDGAKVKVKRRAQGMVRIFVKTDQSITEYRAKRVGECWELWPEGGIAANDRFTKRGGAQ